MKRKQVVILGSGISGLSTAWYLRQTKIPMDIRIIEKNSRAGGWLHTDYTTGFHFEKGPRTFKVNKSPCMMKLIAELEIQDDVIFSEARPHHRYLWHNEELQRFPTNLISFLFSPLTKGFIPALLTEWRQPSKIADETVWEFVLRRFNYDVARLFFDPLVIGIFGGDIRKISVRACFPVLKGWEEKYGSITKGFFQHLKEKKNLSKFSEHITRIPLSAMFSFKRGAESLAQTLISKVDADMVYNQEVKKIDFEKDQIQIQTDQAIFEADLLFNALPAKETGLLFQPHFPELSQELLNIRSQGIAVVNVGYDERVLPVEGFGYLTSTYANEDILGVVFDSSIFPEHNRSQEETRLTIKLEESGKTQEDYINAALKGIRRHLGISRTPKGIHFKHAQRAIPQYRVGHLEKIEELDALFRQKFPHCALVGNYLTGVSVDACIERAKKMVCQLS